MFSRDFKHYRPTPRTTQQAFGPYHNFYTTNTPKKHERLVAIVGVIFVGVVLGLLFGWRG